ncbi:MAG: PH domain-containing protein [Actinomycetota bacterium]
MATPNTPHTTTTQPATLSSLLKPLDRNAILVEDETVYYESLQHWTSILQPVYEAFLALLAIVVVLGIVSGAPSLPAILILAPAVAHIIILIVATGKIPTPRLLADPFSNSSSRGINRPNVLGFLALLVGASFVFTPIFRNQLAAGAVVLIISIITRLVIIVARWALYERRFVTSRRLIESGGFLGSRISYMPLSRLTDIDFSRSVAGEVLGYGTMRVETAGQDQALGFVRFIDRPREFYQALTKLSAPQADVSGSGSTDDGTGDTGGDPGRGSSPPPPPAPTPQGSGGPRRMPPMPETSRTTRMPSTPPPPPTTA